MSATAEYRVGPLDFREVMMLTDLITERRDVLDRSLKALAGEPVDGIEAQLAILKSIEGKVRPPRLAPFAGPSLTLRDSDSRIPLQKAGDIDDQGQGLARPDLDGRGLAR